jgi:hypothetical protein
MAERNQERAFAFIRTNDRRGKPRTVGLTEIRGPYYTPWANDISRMCWKRWAHTSIP